MAAVGLLWWMVAGIVVHASSTLLMPYFDGTGRPQVVSVSIWAGLLINVAAVALLYPLAGLQAAAIGFFFTFLARFVVLYRMFWRCTGTPLHRVLIPGSQDLSVTRQALGASVRELLRRGAG